ncbi:MAG: flagellar biosynthesis protein FlhF [Treponemataceae bacterium]|nr:MAG: flagellar biosynthesis protein FlhF [Treponemataceae bacterium]
MSVDLEFYEGVTQPQTIRGSSYSDCITQLRGMYGTDYCAIGQRTVPKHGFLSRIRGDTEYEVTYGVITTSKKNTHTQSTGFTPLRTSFATEQQKIVSMAAQAIGGKSKDAEAFAQNPSAASAARMPESPKLFERMPESPKIHGSSHEAAETAVMNEVLKNLSLLNSKFEKIENKIETGIDSENSGTKTAVRTMQRLLEKNEFSPRYIEEIQLRLKELTIAELENEEIVQTRTLQLIHDDIKIAAASHSLPPAISGQETQSRIDAEAIATPKIDAETSLLESSPHAAAAKRGKPHIIVIVGPTGVGKTTTVAKLAAQRSIPGKKVHIVTIDNFRIAAKEQIKRYAELMEAKYSVAENPQDIRTLVELDENSIDEMIIDTIGYSPNDADSIARMRAILDIDDLQPEVMLAFSAEKKTFDIEGILTTYKPFNYQSIIVTKVDETTHIGNVLSALHTCETPVSYITNGQKVPRDIKFANPLLFLQKLSDFNSGSF